MSPDEPSGAGDGSGAQKKAESAEFVPASTINEAEEVAKTLGVSEVQFQGYLSIANYVNAGLHALGARRIRPPQTIAVDAGWFVTGHRDAYAAYVPAAFDSRGNPIGTGRYSQAILFNPKKDWGGMKAEIEMLHGNGIYSTSHAHHVLHHEIGHMEYHRKAGVAYGDVTAGSLEMHSIFREQAAALRDFPSQRSRRNYREFVSEVYAMKLAEIPIPKHVGRLYGLLVGPKLPRTRKK